MRVEVAFAFALLALVGACSKSAEPGAANATADAPAAPAAAPATADACSILTKADAERALGHAADKLPSTGGAASLEMCQYGYQGERMMDAGNVSLIYHPNGLAEMRQGLVAEKATIEEVPGLGDGAIYTPEYGLYVSKGGRTAVYMLGVGGMDPAEAKQRMIALAKATVGRL